MIVADEVKQVDLSSWQKHADRPILDIARCRLVAQNGRHVPVLSALRTRASGADIMWNAAKFSPRQLRELKPLLEPAEMEVGYEDQYAFIYEKADFMDRYTGMRTKRNPMICGGFYQGEFDGIERPAHEAPWNQIMWLPLDLLLLDPDNVLGFDEMKAVADRPWMRIGDAGTTSFHRDEWPPLPPGYLFIEKPEIHTQFVLEMCYFYLSADQEVRKALISEVAGVAKTGSDTERRYCERYRQLCTLQWVERVRAMDSTRSTEELKGVWVELVASKGEHKSPHIKVARELVEAMLVAGGVDMDILRASLRRS